MVQNLLEELAGDLGELDAQLGVLLHRLANLGERRVEEEHQGKKTYELHGEKFGASKPALKIVLSLFPYFPFFLLRSALLEDAITLC